MKVVVLPLSDRNRLAELIICEWDWLLDFSVQDKEEQEESLDKAKESARILFTLFIDEPIAVLSSSICKMYWDQPFDEHQAHTITTHCSELELEILKEAGFKFS